MSNHYNVHKLEPAFLHYHFLVQAHGQELWLHRQRQYCDEAVQDAIKRERGKVS